MSAESKQAAGLFNPFPGLRPFSQEESHLFFGREGQSKSVLHSLEENNFVAVIGASGSGKSSLIYCGIIPELLAKSEKKWLAVSTRPGTSPISNMAASLSEVLSSEIREEDISQLKEDGVDLQEWLKPKMSAGQSLLLVIDQFEEIFRFKELGDSKESFREVEQFVDLIYNACHAKDSHIRVVLTMRSDFIGECSVFQSLTELINESNYLIPQMTREDFRKAIEGPVKIGGAKIDEDLVEQLLDEMGIDTDQLPVLQHALMRTWDYWMLQNDPNKSISIEDYEAIGRMSKALSDHANEAFDELADNQRVICERLFKTLTEKGGDNRGVRRPTILSRVAEISRCSEEEVIRIVDLFRTKGRTFLTPYQPKDLSSDTVLDISHESLMRIWDRLRLWVDEEAGSVQIYDRLSEASEMYQEGSTGLWRPPDLQLALNWREKQNPTATWAIQYNPAFERAMVYLETSDLEFKKEEENKIKLQKRRLRVTRIFSLILGAAAVVAMGMFFYARDAQATAEASALEAKRQEQLAKDNADEAIRQQAAALAARDSADVARQDALDAADYAEEQRMEAESASDLARRRQILADRNAREAVRQQTIAELNADTARMQTELANQQSALAEKRRMLSISKSMAVKSLQIDSTDDKDLKALLAFQAYKYNIQYGGIMHDADIYSGLYDARKVLLGENYNVYEGHNQHINSIMFFPQNADMFYSAGSDGKILKRSYSSEDRSYEIFLDNPNFVIKTMNVSPDGKLLAIGTDFNGIYIYRTDNTSAEPIYFDAHNGHVRGLEFSPDGNYLYSFGMDKKILKWGISSKQGEIIGKSIARYTDISLNPDGTILATSDRSGRIKLIDTRNPEVTDSIKGQVLNSVTALDFSLDGDYLAAGDQRGNVKVYNTVSWDLMSSLRGSSAQIASVCFSPEGNYLASSSFDGNVLVWEMSDLNVSPLVMEDNKGYVQTVQFSGDEKYILSGSEILVGRPVLTEMLVEDFCVLIDRNMSQEEWKNYVGSDIKYRNTCPLIIIEN